MPYSQGLHKAFTDVYKKNIWQDNLSVSGPGSNMEQTVHIRKWISGLIPKYQFKKIVDAPCGDFFWLNEVIKDNLEYIESYHGIDIVDELIYENQLKFQSSKITFCPGDLTSQIIPKCDLIICRDCFIHLSFKNIWKLLKNFKISGSEYLLASTYINHSNLDIGHYTVAGRPINLERYPFYFRNLVEIKNEGYFDASEEYNDKSLILLRLDSINISAIYIRILINEILLNPLASLTKYIAKVFKKLSRLVI